MNWIRMPALAGCFAMALSAAAAVGQATPPSSSPQPGSSTGAAPQGRTPSRPNATDQAGTPTGATAGAGADQNGAMSNGMSDKTFVKKAMEGGMAEVKLGQMASEKASSPDVKQFGQKMVDDHSKLNDQMKPIASQMGINPPSDLSGKDKALQSKLEGLSGDQFDKAYMQAMVKDHRKDLSEFQKEASNGKNPQVKDAAQQGAQVIQEHLQMAEQVAQKVGAGSGKMGKMKMGKNSKDSNSSSTAGSSTTPQ
jgi:putative membrane protein